MVDPLSIVTNEDCMDLMSRYPDKYFSLAIVDPPYGINVDGINPIPNKSLDQNHRYDHSKQWYTQIPKREYFEELFRVSVEQIIWGGNYFLDILGYCKAPIIWNKQNGDNMLADGELAWTSKGLPRNLRIWDHQWCGAFKASERGAIKYHPTQKPIALYSWLLKNYSEPGQNILDTHLGSGSSRIACHKAGLDFVGCEIDKDYFEVQEKRFREYKSQLVMELA